MQKHRVKGGAQVVIDTSALLAVLLEEPERPALVAATRGAMLLMWWRFWPPLNRVTRIEGRMDSECVAVFFYGLFMDESLLVSRGISPSEAIVGYVEGYALRIGRRATLVPDERNRAYGVLMTIRAEEVRALYSEESVADYVSESVSVVLPDGKLVSAVCYNLPESQLEGTNPQYANSLLILAGKLGLPGDYLAQIRKQAT